MYILDATFKVLTVCGCWRPETWSAPWKRSMYKAYTTFIILLIYTFTFTQLMDMILNVETSDDFTDNFYIFLAMFVSCSKMCSLLVNQENIEVFMDILKVEPCAPVNQEEIAIRLKLDKVAQLTTIRYMTLVETTIAVMALSAVLTDYMDGQLTYRAWLPYDYSSPLLFNVTFFHQIFALLFGSLLHVACDGLICGLLVHTCCQIDVLQSRLKNITDEQKASVKKCVVHHELIYCLAGTVNKEFRVTISIQFMVSTLVVCFNLYQFAKAEGVTAKFIQLIFYMSCMLTQIFLYCWYGNEVKLKSVEIIHTIFGTSWFTLENDTKKMLLMIMRRATLPIEFTSAYVISMNLDSFVSILKTSYSAFNVLQQT